MPSLVAEHPGKAGGRLHDRLGECQLQRRTWTYPVGTVNAAGVPLPAGDEVVAGAGGEAETGRPCNRAVAHASGSHDEAACQMCLFGCTASTPQPRHFCASLGAWLRFRSGLSWIGRALKVAPLVKHNSCVEHR